MFRYIYIQSNMMKFYKFQKYKYTNNTNNIAIRYKY